MFEFGTVQQGVTLARVSTDRIRLNTKYAVTAILYRRMTAEEETALSTSVEQSINNYVNNFRTTYATYDGDWTFYYQFDTNVDALTYVSDVVNTVLNDPLLTANGNSVHTIGVWSDVEPPPPGQCDTSLDCGIGFECVDGVCVAIPTVCSTDADCPEGQVCVNGICQAVTPTPIPWALIVTVGAMGTIGLYLVFRRKK